MPNYPKIKHKYGAERAVRDGYSFASKLEARRYDELTTLKAVGEVSFFLMQVPFRMPGTKYVCDFMVFWADENVTVEDCKGMRTAGYKQKVKMMAVHYPMVEIVEITYKSR